MTSKFTQADRALDRQQRSFERKLVSSYTASLKEIKDQLAVAYEKYDGSFAEMQKYNRLSNLERNIDKEIAKLTGKNAVTLKKGIGDTFQESYYRAGFTLETTAQAKLGFAQLSKKTIEASINNPLDRVGWLKRNRENQALLTRQVKQQLTQSLIKGESYQNAAKRIKNRMEVGATNVVRIAQTELHRAQSSGRLEGLQQAAGKGVIMKKRWVATLDGDTRDAHQDLDGVTIGIDEDFVSNTGGRGLAPGQLGTAEDDINCFAGDTFVASPTPIEKGYKRYYEGDLIEVTTSTGIKLSGTPNHPILTDQGWISLNQIKAGMNVACASLVKDVIPINPNVDNKPSVISQVFDFLLIGGSTQRTGGVMKQFHGDGRPDSDVDVVTMEGELGDAFKPSVLEPIKQNKFAFANLRTCFLNTFSSFSKAGFRLFRTPKGYIGFLSKFFSFIAGKAAHSKIHGFTSVSSGDSSFGQSYVYGTSGNVQGIRDCLNGFSGKIWFDDIVNTNVRSFKGHVYNLQTKDGFYVASDSIPYNGNINNGIIVHNCRCSMISIIEGYKPKLRRARGEGVIPYTNYNDWKEGRIGK